MRPLFKNDILRVSKDFNSIKCWGVYFLIENDAIVYVGCSSQPLARIFSHKHTFDIHKYHVLYFKTKKEAFDSEKEYIKTFKPIYNYMHNETHMSREEKIVCNKEFKDKKKVNDTLFLTDININILNNSYVKRNKNFYFKINNETLVAKNNADFYIYNGVKYISPSKIFGNINDLILQ